MTLLASEAMSWRERLRIPDQDGYTPRGATEIEVVGDLLAERRRRFLRSMRDYHEAQEMMRSAERKAMVPEEC